MKYSVENNETKEERVNNVESTEQNLKKKQFRKM